MASDFDSFFDESVGAAPPSDVKAPQPKNAGDFDSFFDSSREMEKKAVKQSMFVAATKNPDQYAKAIDLAHKNAVAPALAEAQFDELSTATKREKFPYNDLIKRNPKLAKWMTEPDNASVAHDDIEALGAIEHTVEEHGFMSKIISSIDRGIYGTLAGAAKIPAYVYDVVSQGRQGEKGLLNVEMAPRATSEFRNNPVSQYFEKQADRFKVPETSMNWIDEVGKGNYKRAALTMAVQAAESAPYSLGLMAAAATGYGAAALATAGTIQAANKAEEIQTNNPEVSPGVATLNAGISGAFEAASENIGTMGLFKHWAGAISKQFGKQTAIEVFKDFGKTIAHSSLGEGMEEGINSFAQDVNDWATGVTTDFDFMASMKRAANAAGIGAVSGAATTGPAAITSGVSRAQQVQETKRAKDFYTAMGKSAEATKLRERLPVAQQGYIKQVTAETEVENIYIPVESLETYFQSKNLNPSAVAGELGISNEYNEAKETGGDVKIPLHQWVNNVVGTEHYTPLANDVKFNQDGFTTNELKAEDEKIAAEAKKADEAAMAEAMPKIEAELEKKNDEIQADVTAQLKEAGYSDKEAKAYAQIFRTFRVLGERANMDPKELWDKYKLKISRSDEQSGSTTMQQGPVNFISETETIEFDTDEAKGSGEFGVGDDFINEWLNPEGAYDKKISIKKSGLNNFQRPFVIQDLAVKNESRRQGKGSEVVRAIEQEAIKRGADVILLNASPTGGVDKAKALPGLIKFYESLGYKVVRRSKENAEMFKPVEKTFEQPGDDGARGQISIGKDRKFNIQLLKGADLSTFLHETGHFYLEVMGDLAQSEKATPQIKDDYETILKWLGTSSRDQITTEHHEQWARGFEAYLMEGRAPTNALRQAFAKFKVWLTNIYRSVKSLDVQLSPEVVDVMNRMMATDEEIAASEMQMGSEPLFGRVGALKLNDADADRYFMAFDQAREAAHQVVLSRLMHDFQKARSQDFKEKRSKIKEEVTQTVSAKRVYRALDILQKGKIEDISGTSQHVPDGAKQLTNIKLNKADLIAMIGAQEFERVKNIKGPYVYSRDGGMHPSIAATLLGYSSAHQMIKELVESPDKATAIESETDNKMAELYPDSLTDGSLPQEAIDAYHNDNRAKIIRMEMEFLEKMSPGVARDLKRRMIRRTTPDQVIRTQAAKIIGSKIVGEISPHAYMLAERKAAKQAGEAFAKGDVDAAFQAKQRELLNHELYREALKAREDIQKQLKRFKKLSRSDEDVAKSRDTDLVNAARAILAMFGLGKKGRSAASYLEKMKQYDADSYQNAMALVDSATQNVGSYKEIPYDDFVAMADSVNAIYELSKSAHEIEADGVRHDSEQVREKLESQIGLIVEPKQKIGYDKAVTDFEKVEMDFLGDKASLIRIEHFVESVDGGKSGPFRTFIWNPISQARVKYLLSKEKTVAEYQKILKEIAPRLSTQEIASDELGYVFKNKAELLHAVLHSGNLSNLDKLLRGRNWTQENPSGELDRSRWDAFIARMQRENILTKADYDFAQKVWDLMDSMKPAAQKAHKQMYGYYFSEVTADEIQTPFGNYRGGYVPAKVDIYTTEDAAIRQERDAFEKNNNSFQFPTTGRGHTKTRVQSYAAPLLLDLSSLIGHIDGVLRFTHLEPRIKEVARIVSHKGFRSTLANLDPQIAKNALIPWLQRAAQQKVVLPTPVGSSRLMDASAKFLRKTVAMQMMVGNIVNALQQTTGLFPAMVKVKPKYIRNGLVTYIKNMKGTTESIMERSDFMRTNQASNIYESYEEIDKILNDPTVFQSAQQFALRHTYFLQSATQNIVNSIVWTGGYEQAIENGRTEAQAVLEADSAVRLTQGSNNPVDIAGFEVGTPMKRLFTQFTGYFNMLANLNGFEMQTIARELGLKKGAGKMFYVYAMGFMLPAVMAQIITQVLAGKGIDTDDDGDYLSDLLALFFGSQIRQATALVPYVGTIANAAVAKFNDNPMDDRLNLSPVVSTIEAMATVPALVYRAISEDADIKKKTVKDVLMFIGVASSLPIGPLAKPIGYLMDVEKGKANPENPVDFTRGLVTGQPGQ